MTIVSAENFLLEGSCIMDNETVAFATPTDNAFELFVLSNWKITYSMAISLLTKPAFCFNSNLMLIKNTYNEYNY